MLSHDIDKKQNMASIRHAVLSQHNEQSASVASYRSSANHRPTVNAALQQRFPSVSNRIQLPLGDPTMMRTSQHQEMQSLYSETYNPSPAYPFWALAPSSTSGTLQHRVTAPGGLTNHRVSSETPPVFSSLSHHSPVALSSSSASSEIISSAVNNTNAAASSMSMLESAFAKSGDRFVQQAYLEFMARRSQPDLLQVSGQVDVKPGANNINKNNRKRPLENESTFLIQEEKHHHSDGMQKKRSKEMGNGEEDVSSLPVPRQATYDRKWNDHFNELVAFKAKHGHCRVPQKYEANGALSQWVKRQRYHRKHRPEVLTAGRIQQLDYVGFVWDAQELVWHIRFEELVDYERQNGHSNVPYKYELNQKLATWVKCQRRQYKVLQQGRPSHLNDKRVDLLQGLGFNWNPRHCNGWSIKSNISFIYFCAL